MSDAKKRRLTIPKQNAEPLADDLAKGMLLNDATADVWLKVQDERLPAHRAVLAARCDYFRAMLYGGMQEASAKEVQIDAKFSPALMRAVLRYIYTQQLESVALEDAVPLMACADHFGMSNLRDIMLSQIKESLSLDTIYDFVAQAVASHQELLMEKCLEFVVAHAPSVLLSELFLQLDAPTALRLLRAVDMQDESLLCCRAAVKWQAHWTNVLKHGEESRAGKEARHHLSIQGGEMRQYIDAATMHLVDQLGDIRLVRSGHTKIRPATIVRRHHGPAGKSTYSTIRPPTPRTRFTVHRLEGGACLLGGPLDLPDLVPTPSSLHLYYFVLTRRGVLWMHDDPTGCAEPVFTWRNGATVDVVMSATASGLQVSIHNGTGRCHTCTAGSEVRLWLGLYDHNDEVSVEFMD